MILSQNAKWLLAASALSALGAGCADEGLPQAPEAEDEASGAESALAAVTPDGEMLAAGRAHTCSLDPKISGVICWGDNVHGQTNVPSLANVSFIAAGGDVTCAIASDRLRCWGDRSKGQLSLPRSLGDVSQVAVGDAHVCALTTRGAVRCWGDDSKGQLKVPTLRDVKQLTAGARHSCALSRQGAVTCWGDNDAGQTEVPELAAVTDLAAGGAHTCAIAQGEVVCWGGAELPAIVDDIPEVTNPRAIAAGPAHACVLDDSGVQCWGDPEVDLTPRELTKPEQLVIGGGAGFAHACARHLQGVACWGDNSLKQVAYDGAPLHLLYRSVSDIDAPAELVWDILMDLESYPEWNPYTVAMRSTLEIGDPMIMSVKMSPILTLEQTEHIRVLEPGHKVCWGINTETPELNSGERCQWLEPLPDGGTRYITEDLIEGSLNPLVTFLFGEAVRTGFDSVARALKVRAESLNSGQ